MPRRYNDQFYGVHRVQQLGVGASDPLRDELTVEALVRALRECLQPEVTRRAQELASRMRSQGCVHGARSAAERLTDEFG
jgi:UDP:flavonoid glycosyltransferase YjiC (YdhE family)